VERVTTAKTGLEPSGGNASMAGRRLGSVSLLLLCRFRLLLCALLLRGFGLLLCALLLLRRFGLLLCALLLLRRFGLLLLLLWLLLLFAWSLCVSGSNGGKQ